MLGSTLAPGKMGATEVQGSGSREESIPEWIRSGGDTCFMCPHLAIPFRFARLLPKALSLSPAVLGTCQGAKQLQLSGKAGQALPGRCCHGCPHTHAMSCLWSSAGSQGRVVRGKRQPSRDGVPGRKGSHVALLPALTQSPAHLAPISGLFPLGKETPDPEVLVTELRQHPRLRRRKTKSSGKKVLEVDVTSCDG